METQQSSAPRPIPAQITEEWINDMRRRVLAEDPTLTRDELRAAREHIRQRHLAAGMVTRGKDKAAIVQEEVTGNDSLAGW